MPEKIIGKNGNILFLENICKYHKMFMIIKPDFNYFYLQYYQWKSEILKYKTKSCQMLLKRQLIRKKSDSSKEREIE